MSKIQGWVARFVFVVADLIRCREPGKVKGTGTACRIVLDVVKKVDTLLHTNVPLRVGTHCFVQLYNCSDTCNAILRSNLRGRNS